MLSFPRLMAESADPVETPIYWFAKLEFAVADSDFAAASEAQRQLKRLGIIVNYQIRLPQLAEANRG